MTTARPCVTGASWTASLQHPSYGSPLTYRLAADWVRGCADVADWGGGTGYLRGLLPPTVRYTVVDGTEQVPDQIVADLTTYAEPSDGIVLRHVLDHCADWPAVLRNAIAACRRRLVVVTFTPPVDRSHVARMKSGWPIWHFNPSDLRGVMGEALVRDEDVPTTHPERMYYLERSV